MHYVAIFEGTSIQPLVVKLDPAEEAPLPFHFNWLWRDTPLSVIALCDVVIGTALLLKRCGESEESEDDEE